jgi:hypothetical protein
MSARVGHLAADATRPSRVLRQIVLNRAPLGQYDSRDVEGLRALPFP